MTPQDIAAVIEYQIELFEETHLGRNAERINEGMCYQFAQAVIHEIIGHCMVKEYEIGSFDAELVERHEFIILSNGIDHFWVYHLGRHYDSESPTGVEHWKDLNIFKSIKEKK